MHTNDYIIDLQRPKGLTACTPAVRLADRKEHKRWQNIVHVEH
jgi:hypothetical protein